MVRLKDENAKPTNNSQVEFQFHSGSIKSIYRWIATDRRGRFQFHSGSIKRDADISAAFGGKSFNSIVVRLKVTLVTLDA